ELANPLVGKHLEFYPELTNGLNISKFSQSGKWVGGLARAHRPQMFEANGKHFYIYEPAQLKSLAVVIPIFIVNYQSALHVKCIQLDESH
ncbi:hypothetical protein PTTG_11544, partial [Puccinia triticina 1-1 BBBD Race 1]